MLRSNARRVLAVLAVSAVAFATLPMIATSAQAADAVVPTAAADLPKTVSADSLPTVQINGVVWKQVIVGNTVFAGGEFTSARPAGAAAGTSTVPRSNLLAYDIRTGVMNSSFAPTFNGKINDMAVTPDGSKLVVVGTFTTVNSQARNRVAIFNLPSMALNTTVLPRLNGVANSVAATNSTLYFGGYFSAVNTTTRQRIGAASATTGATLPFSVPVDDGQVQSIVVSPDQASVVLSGTFTTVGGSDNPGYGLYRADAVTGAGQPLPVNSVFRDAGGNSGVMRLASDGDSFYGVGWHYGAGGNAEGTFQASWSSGELVNMEDCHGDTYDVAPIGDVVYTVSHKHYCGNSGGFPQTDPWTFWRANAWTKSTQGTNTGDIYGYPDHPGTPRPELLNWHPDTPAGSYTGKGQASWAVTGNSQYVLLGGEFPRVNGSVQQGIARFAVRSIAPNKQGPRTTDGGTFTPSVKSYEPGKVKVSWPALWDRDDTDLTYQVYRQTNTNKVYETSQSARQWNGKPMSFTDTDPSLTAGTTVRYAVRGVDPSGNLLNSAWITVTVPTADLVGDYGRAVIGDGASKFWRLDETAGDSTVSDWVGADNGAAGTGVTRGAAGALTNSTDTASTFDGTNNGVVVSQEPIAGPNTFSQEVWFKTTNANGGKIAGFGSGATGDSGSYDRHLYMSGGRVYFGVYPGSSQTLNSAAGLADGQWHQAVASLGSDGMALYIDGKRVARRTDVTYGQAYTGYWRLGGDNTWAGDKYFNGSIDDYSVYPTVLTPKQVNSHWVASGRASALPVAPTDTLGKAMYNSDPDLYWRLNEASNQATAADSALGANPGTYTGNANRGRAGVVSGNSAVQLQSPTMAGNFQVTAGGNVTAQTPTSNPTQFSQEVWIKTGTTTGGRIFGFGNSANGSTSNNYDRHLYMLDNGKVRFGVYNGNTVTIDSNASLNDNQWHQLVSTFDATGMKLYVDGVLNSSNSNNQAQNYTGYWKLGGDNTWGGNSSMYFNGDVDEAAVYSRALSPADVGAHYTAGGGALPNQKPTAAFTSTVDHLKVDFDATGSTDTDGTVASYEWNFGGSNTATGPTPNFTFADSGTYPVTLTVTDDDGAKDTITNNVTVTAPPANVKPTAAFTSTANHLKVDFNGSGSTDSDGTVESYEWNFGGSNTSTEATPSFTFSGTGTYPVSLTVTDDDGAKDTITKDVTVTANAKPTAAFSSTATNLKVDFDGSGSADSDGTVESYEWNFGGSNTSTAAKPSFTFAQAGTYPVSLTVTDDDGAKDTITKDVTVTAPPNVKPTAAFSSTATNLKVDFDGSGSTDSDGTVAGYAWNFGGSNTSTEAKPSFTFAQAGTYPVSLTVTDDDGATDTITKNVTVTAAPAANVIANDEFTRQVTAGWGTADTGGAWTLRGATASRYNVAGGAGTMSVASGATVYADLNSVNSEYTRVTAVFSVDKVAEGAYVSLVGRQIGSESYVGRLRLQADGQARIYLLRGSSQIGSTVLVPDVTIVPGTKYTFSLEVTGSAPATLSAKLWKSSDPEPAGWQRTVTHATPAALSGPGKVSVFGYLPTSAAASAPMTVSWDKITVIDPR